MTHYNGFDIDERDLFKIYKNGKLVFTARWQRCLTLEQAKQQIDLSNSVKVLQAKYAKSEHQRLSDNFKKKVNEFFNWKKS